MNLIKRLANRHLVVFLSLTVLISMGILLILCMINTGIFKILEVLYIFPIAFILFIMKKIDFLNLVGFKKKGVLKGFCLGWYMTLFAIINAIVSLPFGNAFFLTTPPITELILLTILDFEVGVYEESMCRGIILKAMLMKWGSSKTRVLVCVLLSSCIFGMLHFVHLIFSPHQIASTTITVISAIFIGVFLAAIYLRSGNLWSVIILHAAYNWIGDLRNSFFSSYNPTYTSFDSGFLSLLFMLPFLLIGLFLLRKVEPLAQQKSMPEIMQVNT